MNVAWTVGLLFLSNCFMTFAWYGHLKFRSSPIWLAIIASWGIAFFEYVLQVPANRIGYQSWSGYQLKIMQECIALSVFVFFAAFYLGEGFSIRYIISFGLIIAAAVVAFYK
ncbi:MAG: DMT family protein [Oligoflexia bacterium]|nr:DMT family protein [Oligoflexia bacterium]